MPSNTPIGLSEAEAHRRLLADGLERVALSQTALASGNSLDSGA